MVSGVICVCVFSGDQRNVFSELSALRRQLRSEQKRLEVRLQRGDWEELDSPLSDRSDPGKCITVALLYYYYFYLINADTFIRLQSEYTGSCGSVAVHTEIFGHILPNPWLLVPQGVPLQFLGGKDCGVAQLIWETRDFHLDKQFYPHIESAGTHEHSALRALKREQRHWKH